MESLKSMTAKLEAPKLEGSEAVGGKDAPALYFGTTKINNNFDVVDEVGKEDGKGMTATLFARGGDEYIRVSTNLPKPDGSGRAVGTVLAGPALEAIKAGKAYYGEVPILGTPRHGLRTDQGQFGRSNMAFIMSATRSNCPIPINSVRKRRAHADLAFSLRC